MGIIEWSLFILPAYVANAVPVIFSGRTPIDFGQRFADGSRFLGKGKTFRGFISGVIGGVLTGILLTAFAPSFLLEYTAREKISIAFLLSIGAMVGDTLGSFAKRRLGLAQGEKLRFADPLGFLIIALLFSIAAFPTLANNLGWEGFVFLAIFTILLHRGLNILAHHLRLKMVPW